MNGFDLAWFVLKDSARAYSFCAECGAGYKGEMCKRCNSGPPAWRKEVPTLTPASVQKALPRQQMFVSPVRKPRRMDQQDSPVSLGTAHPAILPYLRQQSPRYPQRDPFWDEDKPNLRVADKMNPEFFESEDFLDERNLTGDRGPHVNEIETSQGIHEKINPGIIEGKWGEEEGFTNDWGPNSYSAGRFPSSQRADTIFPLSELQSQRQADARGTGDNEYTDTDYDVTGRGPMENRAAENTRRGKLDTQWYIDNYNPEEHGDDLMQYLLENDPATRRLVEQKQQEKEATRLSREGEQSAVLRDIMQEYEPDSPALLGEDVDLTGEQLASRNRGRLMDAARQMAERRGMDPMGVR